MDQINSLIAAGGIVSVIIIIILVVWALFWFLVPFMIYSLQKRAATIESKIESSLKLLSNINSTIITIEKKMEQPKIINNNHDNVLP